MIRLLTGFGLCLNTNGLMVRRLGEMRFLDIGFVLVGRLKTKRNRKLLRRLLFLVEKGNFRVILVMFLRLLVTGVKVGFFSGFLLLLPGLVNGK